jgi:hypothetical protein
MSTFVYTTIDHTPAPHPIHMPAIELQNRIKHEAAITDHVTGVILRFVLRINPLDAANQLSRTEMTKKIIRGQRRISALQSIDRFSMELTKSIVKQISFDTGNLDLIFFSLRRLISLY